MPAFVPVAESPPPIPVRPAAFWWRSLAFLADAIPLGVLAQVFAERLADATALAGKAAWEGWLRQFIELYTKVLKGADPEIVLGFLRTAPPEAIGDWFSHVGVVFMLTFTIVLGLQEVLLGGRTLGKMMVNLRVIDVRTGAAPGVTGCLLRSAWKAMFLWFPSPVLGLLALVNFHLPLFRKDSRAIHDLTTFTQVVDGRASR